MPPLARGAAMRRLIVPQSAMLPCPPRLTAAPPLCLQTRTKMSLKPTRPPQKRVLGRNSKSPAEARKMEEGKEFATFAQTLMIPGHFVCPVWAKWPKLGQGLLRFAASYLGAVVKRRLEITTHKLASKPSMFKRAVWKPPSARTLVDEATALHRRMNTAIAAGDTTALNAICTPTLSADLAATLAERRPGVGVRWRVSYSAAKAGGRARVLSYMVLPNAFRDPDTGTTVRLVQAIVRLRSVQGTEVYHLRTGEVAEEHVVPDRICIENIVLSGFEVSPSAGRMLRWQVFGTVKDTTSQSWAEEQRKLKLFEELAYTNVAKKFKVVGKMRRG